MKGEIMSRLTNQAEKLLQEILEHRLEDGKCDISYWKERFRESSSSDEYILRSLFKELHEEDMITVCWADNCPYTMFLSGKGISYFDENMKEDNFLPQKDTYINNFYSEARNIQIQQGNHNTMSMQSVSDNDLLRNLVEMIKKYDSVLELEYGNKAEIIRNNNFELEQAINTNKSKPIIDNLVRSLREVSINAGGGLISAGIIEIITRLLG